MNEEEKPKKPVVIKPKPCGTCGIILLLFMFSCSVVPMDNSYTSEQEILKHGKDTFYAFDRKTSFDFSNDYVTITIGTNTHRYEVEAVYSNGNVSWYKTKNEIFEINGQIITATKRQDKRTVRYFTQIVKDNG